MDPLSKRERQIMDILYRLGSATAVDVQSALPGKPNYSTVRAHLRILEEKGFLTHQEDGLRYVFRPVVPRDKAGRSALRHLLYTFFDGSAERMVATLLDSESAKLNDNELARLSKMVRDARKERKP
jgi:predicted transcriptional regulator